MSENSFGNEAVFFFISTLKFFHFQIFKLKSVILHFILNINESTKRILAFAKPHQKYLFLSIFFQSFIFRFSDFFSVLVMLPVLQMIFNVDQEKLPNLFTAESFQNIFLTSKLLHFLQHPESITEYGAIKVLAALCIITATSFLFRNISRYFGSFMLVNYRVGITKDLRSKVYQNF